MSTADNTLFLRLAGPMQSWGTSSRFQLRRTDAYPSKSGVLGLLLCAKGISRQDSARELEPLNKLLMGVRVDRPGTVDWDFHTAGAGKRDDPRAGMRKAEGGIKHTGNTKNGPIETLLSRRQYLYDASFLVALVGPADTIGDCAKALREPKWPVFLGRKCCVPAEPVFAGTRTSASVNEALSSVDWRPRLYAIDRHDRSPTRTVETIIEHPAGSPPPAGARLVYDCPQVFGFNSHTARWVFHDSVTVSVGEQTLKLRSEPFVRREPYGPEWDNLKRERRKLDGDLCVFCKCPAWQVHHLDYRDVRLETIRSLCKICHDACNMLEYGSDMRAKRIDPSDPAQRTSILDQINRFLRERRMGRRRELLESVRMVGSDFFELAADSRAEEAH